MVRAIIADMENNVTEHRVLYGDRPEQGFDWYVSKLKWSLVQGIINPNFITDGLCNFGNIILLDWSFIFNMNMIELWFSKIPIYNLLVLLI